MKNHVTEIEVIQAIGNNALSIEDIAKQLGAIRQVVNPTLSALLKQGKVQSQKDSNGWPLFSLTDKVDMAEITTAANEAQPAVVNAKAGATRTTETRHRTPKLEVVKSKPVQGKKVQVEDEQKPQIKAAPAVQEKPAPATPVKSTGDTQYPASEFNLLAYLALQARPLQGIKAKFGDCDALLANLVSKQYVDCDYIIDQHVYTVLSEARKAYPDLSNREKIQALLIDLENQAAPAIKQEDPAKQPEAIKTQIVTPAEEVAAAKEEPVKAAAPVIAEEEAFVEPSIADEEIPQEEEFVLPPNIMTEIARLIQVGVREQIKKERAEAKQGPDLKALAEKIQLASSSLKQAAEALDETLQIINQ